MRRQYQTPGSLLNWISTGHRIACTWTNRAAPGQHRTSHMRQSTLWYLSTAHGTARAHFRWAHTLGQCRASLSAPSSITNASHQYRALPSKYLAAQPISAPEVPPRMRTYMSTRDSTGNS
eukprot:3314596-Rhodomonas_salina.2